MSDALASPPAEARRGRKPGGARSDESRGNILAAARSLFAQKGYDATSLDEIARDAGFTKGAVYYFFGSKEALFLSLLDAIEQRSIGHTASVMAECQGTTDQQISLFVRLQAQWAANNPQDLAILMRSSIDAVNDNSGISRKVAGIYQRMETALAAALRRDESRTRSDDENADAVVSLLALHDGNMLLWYRRGCDPVIGRRLVAATRRAMFFAIRLTR
ncbi:TetR/AcrR family transcriptional regulator [Sphingobium yanoikuyae]|uniref:TetR/AcrR family transcriptional regulator n=1 Tax=Sphingobium yanoikuyae TaxID=13690 RepID=A0A9X7UA46_SPHYA|nr:TetR/AcrR family transcriptional regulator [Sphingobium yanoikuyae]QNG43462.1 TetR/AcrR family transcriptional regulator [Sphingobium yanoikuyae]